MARNYLKKIDNFSKIKKKLNLSIYKINYTSSQKSFMCANTEFTSGIMSTPSTKIGVLDLLRRAVCKTARFSVKLIFCPENIASREASTFLDFACDEYDLKFR